MGFRQRLTSATTTVRTMVKSLRESNAYRLYCFGNCMALWGLYTLWCILYGETGTKLRDYVAYTLLYGLFMLITGIACFLKSVPLASDTKVYHVTTDPRTVIPLLLILVGLMTLFSLFIFQTPTITFIQIGSAVAWFYSGFYLRQETALEYAAKASDGP